MAQMVNNKNWTTVSKDEFLDKLKSQTAKVKKKESAASKKVQKVKEEQDLTDNIEEVNEVVVKFDGKSNDISFDELVSLFGGGFSEKDYREMYKRFIDLSNNYPLRTEMHKEALLTYVKYAFKRDQAIANDDIEAADKWGKLAAKQATDAKINPNQLSAADLSDGISNFSKLVEAVEKSQDVIPILPQYRQSPLDMVDYTIWQYVNYIRRLQNMPDIKYADLYKFLAEQYEKNRPNLNFLTQDPNGHYDSTEEEL